MATEPILYVISGAGLSAASGIPTFREANGLWSQHDIDVVCNALTWKRNRSKVFQFYAMLREQYQGASANAAHATLASWQQRWGCDRVKLLTQNVDLLLEEAGAPAVVHLHGRMDELHCTACDNHWPAAFDETIRCPKCHSLKGVKPGIVMFFESAPAYIQLKKLTKHLQPHDVVVFVGTAFQVLAPGSLIPLRYWGGERIVNINPEASDDRAIGTQLQMTAVEGLAQLEPRLTEWMAG